MLRYIIILLNVALLVGVRGFYESSSKTKITQYVPNSAFTGNEFIEEIIITKPSTVNTFAKFEQQLPKGFVAVGLEIKGGVLSQDENNLLKIVWYKISDLDQFTIKLRILVDHETSLNEYSLTSRFAYLENNTRYTINSSTSKITIEKGAEKQLDESEKELTVIADTTLHKAFTENIDKMLREAGVACTQVSEMLSKNEAKIDIRVIKNSITGFAKIEEPICEGATAVNIESGGAVFSFIDGKVKYVWTDLPAGQKVTVSYKLIRKKEAVWLNRCTVAGDFSYLEGEKSLRCNFNAITVDFEKGITVPNLPIPANLEQQKTVEENNANKIVQNKADAVADKNNRIATPTQPTTTIEATSTANKAEALKVQTEQIQSTKVAANKEEIIAKQATKVVAQKQASEAAAPIAKTNLSAASTAGVMFRVQVCATHRSADANFVKSNYKLAEDVNQEMHEGWFKYTIGGFGQYIEARNKREDLAQNNIPGPFVAAYNNGNRITVQEALMITKQQWLK